ncbi:MAG: O-antigen ligase family protein [Candidatus Pacebacteria bacterium]|nr:O-antigen ligase family protein [Candidatus Paceibacterota bacterium]
MTKIVRWITLGALFIIPFLPLVVFNGFFFPFITGKNFAFRILVEVAFAGWILLALVDKKYRPRFSWTFVIFAALVVWMIVADAFGVSPMKAFWSNFERMDGWVTLIHVFLFFVVAGAMFSAEKLWQKWWFTFLSGATLVCLYAVLQVLGVFAIHQGGVRVDATFGNAEYLAAYLLFAIAVSVWQAFEAKETKWLRWSLIVLTLLELVVLYYTATRGAIIGLVGAAILGSVLWMFEAGKRGRRYAATALVLLVLISGVFYLGRNSSFVQHDATLNRIGSISVSDGETRFAIWHMAFEGFLARPITGWGQEGFNYVFNRYYDPSLYSQEQWFDRAHDVFLDWLVAGGAPALLLFLALLGAAVLALYSKNVSRTERVMLISALAAYGFQGLFVFDNLFTYVPLAAILAMAHMASSRPIARMENAPELSADNFQTIALPVTFVGLVVVFWFANVPSMRAAGDIITAITPGSDAQANISAFKQAYADGSFADQEITEQLLSYAESTVQDRSVSLSDKQAMFSYAMQQAQVLIAAIPDDARIRLEYALALRAGGDYADAITQSGIAEKLSPMKQTIMIEEGVEQWQAGNFPTASALFTKAYQLDTSFQTAAAYAAAGKMVSGDIPGGKALLVQSFGTTTVDQDPVLLAYYQTKDLPDFLAVWRLRVIDQGNSADAELGLAAALADAGQISAARAEIQAAIAAHPEAASEGEAMLAQIASSTGS